MIGKIEKRRARPELLALKQQRRLRPEQQQGRKGAIAPGARQLMQPAAIPRIGDLVVILQAERHPAMRDVPGGAATALPLPRVILALI